MKNLYVIVSSDKATQDVQIENILFSMKEYERIDYDLAETPIEQVIEDLDTIPLFSKRKGIVAYQAMFLSAEKGKSEVDHNLKVLEKYLSNPNPENILILVTESIDKRKKIVSTLLEKATVLEKEIPLNDILKDKIDDYKIDKKTLDFLIGYCGNHNERVLQELEKLKTYKWEEKEITISDIKEVVSRNIEDNIFSLVDSILNGNKKDSFAMYQNLLLHGEQASSVLSKLANKIRLIYQVKILAKDGSSDQEIGKKLSVHPYPVKLAREASYKYSEGMLLEYLQKLAQVDLNMKQGNTVAGLSFEVFMASI